MRSRDGGDFLPSKSSDGSGDLLFFAVDFANMATISSCTVMQDPSNFTSLSALILLNLIVAVFMKS